MQLRRQLVALLFLGALLFTVERAQCQESPTASEEAMSQTLSKELAWSKAKAEAWKIQAVYLSAQLALERTPEYREVEKRQTDLQGSGPRLQSLCGEGFTVQWTREDIVCAPIPKPAPSAPTKEK